VKSLYQVIFIKLKASKLLRDAPNQLEEHIAKEQVIYT